MPASLSKSDWNRLARFSNFLLLSRDRQLPHRPRQLRRLFSRTDHQVLLHPTLDLLHLDQPLALVNSDKDHHHQCDRLSLQPYHHLDLPCLPTKPSLPFRLLGHKQARLSPRLFPRLLPLRSCRRTSWLCCRRLARQTPHLNLQRLVLTRQDLKISRLRQWQPLLPLRPPLPPRAQ
jgi:hypothetical protein